MKRTLPYLTVFFAALCLGQFIAPQMRTAYAGADGYPTTDTKVQNSPVWSYALISTGAIITGEFVDKNGVGAVNPMVAPVPTQESYSVTSQPTTLTVFYDVAHGLNPITPLPSNFVGFKCNISNAAIEFNNDGLPNGTIQTNPTTSTTQMPIYGYNVIGTF